MISVHVYGEAELRRLAADLRQAPGHLQRQLLAATNLAGRTAANAIQDAIRDADVHGQRRGGRPFRGRMVARGALRAPMARAVEVRVSMAGTAPVAELRVYESRVPRRIRQLVKYVVGYSKRWRHPIMGTNAWVGQNAPTVWPKVAPKQIGRFSAGIRVAVDNIERSLRR